MKLLLATIIVIFLLPVDSQAQIVLTASKANHGYASDIYDVGSLRGYHDQSVRTELRTENNVDYTFNFSGCNYDVVTLEKLATKLGTLDGIPIDEWLWEYQLPTTSKVINEEYNVVGSINFYGLAGPERGPIARRLTGHKCDQGDENSYTVSYVAFWETDWTQDHYSTTMHYQMYEISFTAGDGSLFVSGGTLKEKLITEQNIRDAVAIAQLTLDIYRIFRRR